MSIIKPWSIKTSLIFTGLTLSTPSLVYHFGDALLYTKKFLLDIQSTKKGHFYFDFFLESIRNKVTNYIYYILYICCFFKITINYYKNKINFYFWKYSISGRTASPWTWTAWWRTTRATWSQWGRSTFSAICEEYNLY